ncbi:hypothetical protein LSM04_000519 [Trypanosoma melophagium]|uniref:uncharacterized protein n=1 Tax=Trypanosoma melophagium TaxID=715481 RepID=UPI00351A1B91|nr:hypothetical protein LSM04_000519 [Trypanosoma melophagium]
MHWITAKGISAPLLLILLLLLSVTCDGVSSATTPTGSLKDHVHTKKFIQTFKDAFGVLRFVWTGKDYCKYKGVQCDEERNEVHLWLPGAKLSGGIPSFNKKFDPKQVRIASINLMGNKKLKGAFPAYWSELSNLQHIFLNNTGLSGTVPNSWNALQNLVSVFVGDTQACGSLPKWDSSAMRNLKAVSLKGNKKMSGTLSQSFGTLGSQLLLLDLSGTQFCGCAPSTWNSPLLRSALNEIPKVNSTDCKTINACSAKELTCGSGKSRDIAAFPSNQGLFWITATPLIVLFLTL